MSGRHRRRRRRHYHQSSSSPSSSSYHGARQFVDPFRALTYPEVSAMVFPVSFCLRAVVFTIPGNLLLAFCLHVVSSFFCSSVFCPNLALNLIPLQSLYFFYNTSKCVLLFLSYTRISSLLLLFFFLRLLL